MKDFFILPGNKSGVIYNRKQVGFLERQRESFQEFLTQLAEIAANQYYPGHRLSRLFCYVLEKKRVREILGVNLVIAIFLNSLIALPTSAFGQSPTSQETEISSPVLKLTTNESIKAPLASLKINQGYHPFHRAIDFGGKKGEPLYPIMNGRVEKLSHSYFAYGNHLIIDHGGGFKSLYAHLEKIIVKEGEVVDKNTIIGTLGATGWATGPHLHLEVSDNGEPINPLTVLK